MKIKDYALLAKNDIINGYHDNVKDWAYANYSNDKTEYLTNEIINKYGERAENR